MGSPDLSRLPLLLSFQVRHGSSWSNLYGAQGLNPQEFHLQKGEHITGVLGSFRHVLSCLVVHTSLWPFIRFGCLHGQFFIASPDGSQKALTGVYGQYTVQGISSIGSDWDYPSG